MLTLFEHQTQPFAWDPRRLAALERLNRALGDDMLRPVLDKSGCPAVRATQYVGVVRLGRETIQILPKIYRQEACQDEEAAHKEATRNLLHLLSVAADLPVREHALAPLLRRRADWFEILTRLFATHLTDAWQRGIVRGYVPIEDDASPLLRGKWRLTAQLRHPARRHRFCVTYDEFTPDNPLNRVLRFVVERLWTLTRDADNRRALSTLRAWMDEVRRRFTFVEMPPDPTLLSEEVAGVSLQALLMRLNKRVGMLLDPDHRIGHSYLMGVQNADDLHFAWYRRIVPLLQEYFYHDGERLQAVVGEEFVKAATLDPETTKALGTMVEERARYEVQELEVKEFLKALRGLAGQQ